MDALLILFGHHQRSVVSAHRWRHKIFMKGKSENGRLAVWGDMVSVPFWNVVSPVLCRYCRRRRCRSRNHRFDSNNKNTRNRKTEWIENRIRKFISYCFGQQKRRKLKMMEKTIDSLWTNKKPGIIYALFSHIGCVWATVAVAATVDGTLLMWVLNRIEIRNKESILVTCVERVQLPRPMNNTTCDFSFEWKIFIYSIRRFCWFFDQNVHRTCDTHTHTLTWTLFPS